MGQAIQRVSSINLDKLPKGRKSRYLLQIVTNGLGLPIEIPVIVARGEEDGPVLGISAAVHGNELNGVLVIQRLFHEIDPKGLRGTIVGIPVVNVPGYLSIQRFFNDDQDLNRIMPGKKNGNLSEVYAYRLIHRIFNQFEYLLDLHTASFGRVNSYYIRVNLENKKAHELALLQNAQIILHSPAPDNTLRGAMSELGLVALTLEVGDPNRFQRSIIHSGLDGVHNTIINLGMMEGEIEKPEHKSIICHDSTWIYTDEGGVLQVFPNVADKVEKGEKIAHIRNIFGDVIRTYTAPANGVIIGKSIHPVAQTGSRIIHFGVV